MFGRLKRVHFVGIGGIGMSGIALVLKNMGFDVAGSDAKESDTTRKLAEAGIRVFIGHDAAAAIGVVVSQDYPGDARLYHRGVHPASAHVIAAGPNGRRIEMGLGRPALEKGAAGESFAVQTQIAVLDGDAVVKTDAVNARREVVRQSGTNIEGGCIFPVSKRCLGK